MPPSLAERLLDAAWDEISAAVRKGLAGEHESTLADVVPLTERPYGKPQIDLPPWESEPSAPSSRDRLAVAAGETFIQLRFDARLTLGIDSLDGFDVEDAVTEWAASARRRELTSVLEILAAVGEPARLQLDAMRRLLPEGFGTPEFVLWEPLPGRLDAIEASFGQAPKIVAAPATENSWVRGLILRRAGGVSVRRGQDLTLDWLPLGENIELVLMGHLRIYNATSDSITTLVDPAVTAAVGV